MFNTVEKMDLHEIINHPNATIIDVRTPGEFAMTRVPGAINIPLNEVPDRVEDFRTMQKPIVVHCASGNRSGQAMMFLRHNGIDEVYNGGGVGDMLIHKM